eukprot:4826387-Pleurochrysis_carterae.AAC.7
MSTERVNLVNIRRHASHHVSREHFAEFLSYFNFTDTVDASISELLERTDESQKRAPTEIDVPVKAVVDILNRTTGTTFAKACNQCDANLLGLDLSKWGGGRAGCMRHISMPWEKAKAAKIGQNNYRAYVADHCKPFPWHKWAE